MTLRLAMIGNIFNDGYKLIRAPFVIIAGGRIVAIRGKTVFRVPIEFDVTDVTIRETNRAFGIVDSGLSTKGLLIMPGEGPEGGKFRNQNGFDRIFYRGEFSAIKAGKRSLVWQKRGCVESSALAIVAVT
jgi:hypothetical protein